MVRRDFAERRSALGSGTATEEDFEMARTFTAGAVAIGLQAAQVAGCGGSSGANGDFVNRANAICKRLSGQLAPLGAPSDPTQIVEQGKKAVAFETAALNDMRVLKVPKSAQRDFAELFLINQRRRDIAELIVINLKKEGKKALKDKKVLALPVEARQLAATLAPISARLKLKDCQ
jgi:hypothetical protein